MVAFGEMIEKLKLFTERLSDRRRHLLNSYSMKRVVQNRLRRLEAAPARPNFSDAEGGDEGLAWVRERGFPHAIHPFQILDTNGRPNVNPLR